MSGSIVCMLIFLKKHFISMFVVEYPLQKVVIVHNLLYLLFHDIVSYRLPCVIECPYIPFNKSELRTSNKLRQSSHLANIASFLLTYDPNSNILMLIGRDAIDVHKVHCRL